MWYVKGTNLYIVPQYLYIVHGCFPKNLDILKESQSEFIPKLYFATMMVHNIASLQIVIEKEKKPQE